MREIEGFTKLYIVNLPNGVFCELGKNSLPPEQNKSKRGKLTGGGGKGGSGRKSSGGGTGISDALELMVEKNSAQQQQLTMESISLAHNNIVVEIKRKREAFDDLVGRLGDKKKVRKIVKSNNYKVVDESDIESDKENDDEDKPARITESQGELVDQYHAAAEDQITYLKKQCESLTKTAAK